jgi:hypothetical protein
MKNVMTSRNDFRQGKKLNTLTAESSQPDAVKLVMKRPKEG